MRKWKSGETVKVVLDDTGKHRFKIVCSWDNDLPQCLYIMFNPSTADMEKCDYTLDRCIKIAKHNGFGSISVVNLFSIRTPHPDNLLNIKVKSLPDNFDYIKSAIEKSEKIVAAWGEKGAWFNGIYPVLKYIDEAGRKLYCLDENRYGMPSHPRTIKATTDLKDYAFKKGISTYS